MKKSFILYSDQINLFKKLNGDQVKTLMLEIFNHVNGTPNESQIDDPVVDMAFEAIKLALDRDMETYNNICERNRINGLHGGRPPKPKKPSGLSGNPKNPREPKKADSGSGSDNGNESERTIYTFYIELLNPKFKNRAGAEEWIKRRLKVHSFDDLKIAVQNYKEDLNGSEYVKDPRNFFGKDKIYMDFIPGRYVSKMVLDDDIPDQPSVEEQRS